LFASFQGFCLEISGRYLENILEMYGGNQENNLRIPETIGITDGENLKWSMIEIVKSLRL